MHIETFNYNDEEELSSNTYIICDSNHTCIVVDPGKQSLGISNYITKHNLSLKGIFLTHAHFDHIGGVSILLENHPCKTYIFNDDFDKLENPSTNLSVFVPKLLVIKDIDVHILHDNDVINVFEYPIICIHTPFHTSGSGCFYLKDNKALFSGDTLFKEGIGRVDFPTGNSRLVDSSLAKLKVLDENTKVYPGHGPSTTIGLEKRNNPYLR